jgi:hypothetical protein
MFGKNGFRHNGAQTAGPNVFNLDLTAQPDIAFPNKLRSSPARRKRQSPLAVVGMDKRTTNRRAEAPFV